MEMYFPPEGAMDAAKLSPNRNKKGFSAAVGPSQAPGLAGPNPGGAAPAITRRKDEPFP